MRQQGISGNKTDESMRTRRTAPTYRAFAATLRLCRSDQTLFMATKAGFSTNKYISFPTINAKNMYAGTSRSTATHRANPSPAHSLKKIAPVETCVK